MTFHHIFFYPGSLLLLAITIAATSSFSVNNNTANFTLPSLIAAKSTAALATAHANSSWCTDPVNSWVTKCSCSELLSAQESTSTVFYTYQEGTSTVTGSLFEIYQNGPTWEMPMDCCYDCEIFATEVSLLYWPVGEDTRNASVVNSSTPYTLISDGFTYVSPSVYISYTNLRATVNCVLTDAVRTGGLYNTLIAYPPEALSTQACTPLTSSRDPFTFESGFNAVNYTQMEQQTDFCSERDYEIPGNPDVWTSRAVPFYLSFPPGLSLIDPVWKSCKNFEPGALDPPRTLDKATALVGPGPNQASTAAPGAKPTPSQVLATPTPTADDGGKYTSGLPTPAPGSQAPDPPIGDPGKDDPPPNPEPPATPVLNSAVVSSILQNLPQGGSSPETPAHHDNPPPLPGGSAGADQSPGPMNTQDADPASSPGGLKNPPSNNDLPLPSIGTLQIQKAENGGIIIGSKTLRPGAQTTPDGTPVSVGSDRVIIGDSTIPLAAPTELVPGSNPIVMAAPDPVVVGGNTVDRLPGRGILIAGSTYSSGTHTRISGTDVSVGADRVVIDGATHMLPSQNTPTPVLIGGQTVAEAASGGVVIGSSTYLPGAQGTAFGTAFSVGADSVVVDGSPYKLPIYATKKPILVGSESVTRAPDGGVVIGDSTVAPGSQEIISGHTISAGFSSVAIDGSTYALPANIVSEHTAPQSIMLANGVVISAGGNAATVSGTTYTMPSNDGAIIINGKTVSFNPEVRSVFSIAGQTFTANPTGFVVDGHSVLPDGSPVVIAGTTVSLGPSGLQIGSSTIPLTSPLETDRVQSVFTVAGQTFTANPTGFAVDGHSVSIDGTAVTLSGTVISLGPSGLRIGSSMIPLTAAQETAHVGLGGIILSGFAGNGGSANNGSSPVVVAFTGTGPMSFLRGDGIWSAVLAAFGLCVGLVAYAL